MGSRGFLTTDFDQSGPKPKIQQELINGTGIPYFSMATKSGAAFPYSTLTPMPTVASSSASLSTVTTYSSLSSGSTAMTVSTAAAPPPVAVRSMVSNRPADSEGSLYQICLNLKRRLLLVRGLRQYLDSCESDFDEESVDDSARESHCSTASSSNHDVSTTLNYSSSSPVLPSAKSPTLADKPIPAAYLRTVAALPPGMKIDPVTHVWRFFRMGCSLCALFNALEPRVRLVDTLSKDVKAAKRSLYHFVQGCKSELDYSDDKLFTISNVFSDNTTVLLKVRSYCIKI
jgi:cell division control protein 24